MRARSSSQVCASATSAPLSRITPFHHVRARFSNTLEANSTLRAFGHCTCLNVLSILSNHCRSAVAPCDPENLSGFAELKFLKLHGALLLLLLLLYSSWIWVTMPGSTAAIC
ncbi:hypothetical protein Hdeb2414_s0026g00674371 [Helianthus debilis subsp. tardiflorus]